MTSATPMRIEVLESRSLLSAGYADHPPVERLNEFLNAVSESPAARLVQPMTTRPAMTVADIAPLRWRGGGSQPIGRRAAEPAPTTTEVTTTTALSTSSSATSGNVRATNDESDGSARVPSSDDATGEQAQPATAQATRLPDPSLSLSSAEAALPIVRAKLAVFEQAQTRKDPTSFSDLASRARSSAAATSPTAFLRSLTGADETTGAAIAADVPAPSSKGVRIAGLLSAQALIADTASESLDIETPSTLLKRPKTIIAVGAALVADALLYLYLVRRHRSLRRNATQVSAA